MLEFQVDHKHIIVGASIRQPPVKTDMVTDWLTRMVDAVGMKLVLGPFAHYCTAENNEGIAGICAIETSHCSIHVWDKEEVPYLRFDLYSCSAFNVEQVLELIQEFDCYFYEWVLIDRNTGIERIDHGHKQITKVIDLLTEDERKSYLEAQKTPTADRTSSHKKARSKYAKLRRKYSFAGSSYSNKRVLSHHPTLSCIKARCKKKDLPFNLDAAWYNDAFLKAQEKHPKIECHSKQQFWSADVDRKDPERGYTKDNCRIIPHGLNVAKWNWSKTELSELYMLLREEVTGYPCSFS